jgi:hypothetical protein
MIGWGDAGTGTRACAVRLSLARHDGVALSHAGCLLGHGATSYGLSRLVAAARLPVPDAAVGRLLRIVLDWTLALFFRPDITEVGLRVERQLIEQMLRSSFSKNRPPTV